MVRRLPLQNLPPPRPFYDQIVEDRFNDNFAKRQPLLEKGFILKNSPYMEFNEVISFVIEKVGWKMFCCHPDDVYPQVVREFYSHLTTDSPFAYVTGISILFDTFSNSFYGFHDVIDEHTAFVDAMTNEGLDEVLKDLCIDRAKWIISKQDSYTIERTELKTYCRVWNNFLETRLMQTVHNTTISKERLLLLHSIMKGRKINVGAIIFYEVHKCAQKNAGSLSFPSLFSAMCQQARVPLKENEELMENKGALTKHAVSRIRKEESTVQTPQGLASTSATSMFATVDTLTSKTPFERQVLAYLNRMSKQDAALETKIIKLDIALERSQHNMELLWAYVKERDDAIQ